MLTTDIQTVMVLTRCCGKACSRFLTAVYVCMPPLSHPHNPQCLPQHICFTLYNQVILQGNTCYTCTAIKYHIAGNFRGRKLSQMLRFCGYLRKFSLRSLGAWVLWRSKNEQSAKVFSAKIVFFTNSRKFSLLKVSCYTVVLLSMNV